MADQKRNMTSVIILDILREKSSRQNPITKQEIVEELARRGYPRSLRAVQLNIEQLINNRYEISTSFIGHQRAYYIETSPFELAEYILIMDALEAANFLSEKKTAQLTEKIARLSGLAQGEELKRSMFHFNRVKHTNDSIMYSIDAIKDAIYNSRKIGFYYFKLNEEGAREYQKDKALYIENPVTLIYRADFYYLIAYNEKHHDLCHYRIDRMESVQVLNESVCPETKAEHNLVEYCSQLFGMYSGDLTRVTFSFSKPHLGDVQDRFGEKISIESIDEEWYRTTVDVQLSPPFLGWVFMMGKEIVLEAPEALIHEYKSLLTDVATLYG